MELRHLRYFVAVAEEESISRAARRLRVAQPPLSTQMRELEEDLGVSLLVRSPRGATLTVAGRVFLEEARRTLEAAEAARAAARRAAGQDGDRNSLRVGSLGTWHLRYLQGAFAHLRKHRPGLRLHFVNGPTDFQVTALIEEEIDVGILHPPVGSAHAAVLALRPLAHLALLAALPAAHPLAAAGNKGALALRELRDAPFILPPRRTKSTLYDFILEQCRGAGGFAPRVVREEANLSNAINLVAAGEGVSLVPAHLREPGLPGVVYRSLARPVEKIQISLAWRRDARSTLLRNLLGALPA